MAEITRDPISGKITSTKLLPQEARKLAEKAHENRLSGRRLLEEAGYPDYRDAPEHLQVLARIACSHRSGAVPALNAFLKLTGQAPDSTISGLRKPLEGETCPLCGTVIKTIAAKDALRMLQVMGRLGVENAPED